MALKDETIEALVARYVKDGDVIAFGTSEHAERFVKKLALALEDSETELQDAKVVPTSAHIASLLSELKVPAADISEHEVDLAVEFVDSVDKDFNFIKKDSASFVRDKMIAQSAAELIVIVDEDNYVKRLQGIIPFEIASFGWKRSVVQLEKLGAAKIREKSGRKVKTETGHYIVDVKVDDIYSLEDLEFQAKEIPGVLETGLFIGYADRVLLHGKKGISVKSRMDYSRQDDIEEELKNLV